jgi:DNA-binding MarR family transcriptional regulator
MLEDELFQRHELTAQQYNALRLLRAEHPAALPTLVLAGKLVSHAPDITRLVDRLEERGLVARQRLTDNRRVVQVRITEAGLALLKGLDQPVRDCHLKQLGHLSGAQIQSLIELLRTARQPHEEEESTWQ